jgi:YVTN family beta-propeller protein
VVSVLGVRDNTVVGTSPVGTGAHSIEAAPDGSRLTVVNYVGGTASVLDPASDTVVATVPDVGAQPQDVPYAPDGRHFYTASHKDGTVSVVDRSTDTVVARVSTGAGPTGVCDELRRRPPPRAADRLAACSSTDTAGTEPPGLQPLDPRPRCANPGSAGSSSNRRRESSSCT